MLKWDDFSDSPKNEIDTKDTNLTVQQTKPTPITIALDKTLKKTYLLLYKDQSSRYLITNNWRGQKAEQLLTILENETKTVRLHWKQIPSDLSKDALWFQLPDLKIDNQKFKVLLRIKENRLSSSEVHNIQKEILVLDRMRSNQINIGTKNLPPLCDIRSIILQN